MKILWLSWKDIKNPLAGGAEVVADELLKRMASDGHEVILLTAGYAGAAQEENHNGYKIIRVGGRWSVYWQAFKYYRKNLKNWADVAIEEINTIPFFSQTYSNKEKRFLFFHQLCREIWFYQMFFPLNLIGYLIEPIYLFGLRKNQVITVSESTKKDLCHFGFKPKNISIISEGIEMKPVSNLNQIEKYSKFTILSLGAIREMKRTIDQVKAFELAKKEIPELQLKIAGGGEGKYFDKVMSMIEASPYKHDIEYLGRVSTEKKIELMQKSHIITVTSVKEGWGLVVTEANSQGTPAIVYNVDGLRDSVKDNETGLITEKNTAGGVAAKIIYIFNNRSKYDSMRENAHRWSSEINFDQSFAQIMKIINAKQ